MRLCFSKNGKVPCKTVYTWGALGGKIAHSFPYFSDYGNYANLVIHGVCDRDRVLLKEVLMHGMRSGRENLGEMGRSHVAYLRRAGYIITIRSGDTNLLTPSSFLDGSMEELGVPVPIL